jgi:hypothetical protein
VMLKQEEAMYSAENAYKSAFDASAGECVRPSHADIPSY